MRIEINPRSLLNLQNICEVLYKLHPSVLDYLVKMQRSLGAVLGLMDLENLSLKEREFLSKITEEVDYSELPKADDLKEFDEVDFEKLCEKIVIPEDMLILKENKFLRFDDLIRYLKLDTDEYIPMKFYVEVEDPIIGKKLKELVEALEKTIDTEQFYLSKRQIDEDAYFAEGYNLIMNEEQEKKMADFYCEEDVKGLRKLLMEKKLCP